MKQLRTGVVVGILISAALAYADTTWVAEGWVSGNWNLAGSPYVISDGWIHVHADSTLTIQPGVEVYFDGPQMMVVRGRLTAVGTALDSIYFIGADVDTLEDAWRGLVFIGTDTTTADSSRLAYTVLERADGLGFARQSGGAIQCLQASPRFENCALRHNRTLRSRRTLSVSSRYGGGAYLFKSNAEFTACEFASNNPGPLGMGGAVFIDDTSSATFENCTMHDDTAAGGGAIAVRNAGSAFYNCEISDNVAAFNGGGIHLGPNYATFQGCTIASNTSGQCGGGIFAYYGINSPVFTDCRIIDNGSFWGGGIYCGIDVNMLQLSHSVVVGNVAAYGGGLYVYRSWPSIISSAISYNTSSHEMGGGLFLNRSGATIYSTVISHSYDGEGIYFLYSPAMNLGHCDIAENAGGAFGCGADPDKPGGLGELVAVNANGDSCDARMNIYFDPRFVDASAGDFHPDWNSPCIDAGDPFYGNDPDGSPPDIGAFYRDIAAADPERPALRRFELAQNYPNPFNATTRIEFDLPRAGEVELAVYDVTGRLVATLLSGNLLAGQHNVNWDASRLPSGVYAYRLRTPDGAKVKKMVLLK